MANEEKLSATVSLDADPFLEGVDAIEKALTSLDNTTGQVSKNIQKQLSESLGINQLTAAADNVDQIASKLTALGDAAAASFAAINKPAAEFQSKVADVATVSGLSAQQMAVFEEQVRTLDATVQAGTKPLDGMSAAFEIFGAGSYGAAGTTNILTQSMIAAGAGTVSLKDAADVLTTVINGYGLAASDAQRVTDILTQSAATGKTTFGEMAPLLGSVIPIAQNMGVSLEELGAGIAVLTARSGNTPQAVDQMKAAITALGAHTKEAQKVAAGFGIQLDDNFLKSRGLAGALEEIIKKTGGSNTAIRRILGDVQGLAGGFAIAQNNAKDFKNALAANFASAGKASADFKIKSETLESAENRLAAAQERLSISVGKHALPALTALTNAGTSALDTIDRLPGPFKATADVLLGLGAVGFKTAGFVGGIGATALQAAASFAILKANGGSLTGIFGGLVSKGGAISKVIGVLPGLLGGVGLAAVALAGSIAIGTAAFDAWNRSAKEIQDNAARLSDGMTKVSEASKSALTGSAQDLINAQGKAQALAEIGGQLGVQRNLRTQEASKPGGGDAKLIATYDLLIKELEAKRQAIESGAVKAIVQTATQVGSLTGEELKKRLFIAETTATSDKDRLNKLQEILAGIHFEGDEQRSVAREIATLKKKIASDESTAGKKAFQEKFDEDRQLVEHSKEGVDAQIAQTEVLLKKYEADTAKKRTLEDDLAKFKKAKTDEAIKQVQALADAESDAAEARKAASETTTAGLERSRSRGTDVTDALIAERKKQGQAEIEAIQKKLDEDLAKPDQSSKAKIILRNTAKTKIQTERDKTAQDIQGIRDQSTQDSASRKQDELSTEKAITDARLNALKEQQAAGKDVQAQLLNETLESQKTQEAAINARLAAELTATDNLTQKTNLQRQAQLEIFNLHKATAEELDAQAAKWDEIKKKTEAAKAAEKGPIQSSGAGDFTLGGISSDVNDRSAFTSSGSSDFEARKAATLAAARKRLNRALAGAGQPQDILNQTDRLRTPGIVPEAPLVRPKLIPSSPQAAGFPRRDGDAQPGRQKVDVGFKTAEVRIIGANGKEIGRGTLEPVTLDGEGAGSARTRRTPRSFGG